MSDFLVQLTPHRIHHRAPGLGQAVNLLRFNRVIDRNLFQPRNLILHQSEIGNRPDTCSGELCISMQRAAGVHNVLVGFGGGHGLNVTDRRPH